MGNPNYDALAADYFQVFRANYKEKEEEYYFEHIAQVQGLDAPDRTENIIVEQCRPFLANCGEIFLVVAERSLLHQWIADRTTFDDEEEKNDGNSDTSQTSVKYTDDYQTSDTSNRRTTDSGRYKTEDSRRTRSPQGRNKETSKDDRKRGTSTRRERDQSRSPGRDRGRRGDERREDSRPRRDRDNKSKRNRSRSRSHSRDHDRDSQRNRGRSDERQGRGRMDKGKEKTRIVVDGVETLEQRFGAKTMDGRMVTGDTRSNLHERLRLSEGGMPITSLEKQKHVIVDLLFVPVLLWRVLCDGGEDADLDNQHGGYTETHLMHAMTSLTQFATAEATRDFATMRGWTKGDHTVFSLRNMRRQSETIHPWGDQATVAGKESGQDLIKARRLAASP